MKNVHFEVWKGIGLNILHYRKEQKLTQLQLAEKCHVSRNFLQKIETAVSTCSFDTLIDIANALDIPIKELMEFRD